MIVQVVIDRVYTSVDRREAKVPRGGEVNEGRRMWWPTAIVVEGVA